MTGADGLPDRARGPGEPPDALLMAAVHTLRDVARGQAATVRMLNKLDDRLADAEQRLAGSGATDLPAARVDVLAHARRLADRGEHLVQIAEAILVAAGTYEANETARSAESVRRDEPGRRGEPGRPTRPVTPESARRPTPERGARSGEPFGVYDHTVALRALVLIGAVLLTQVVLDLLPHWLDVSPGVAGWLAGLNKALGGFALGLLTIHALARRRARTARTAPRAYPPDGP